MQLMSLANQDYCIHESKPERGITAENQALNISHCKEVNNFVLDPESSQSYEAFTSSPLV